MSTGERFLPTLAALSIIIGAGCWATWHLTLGLRAFTAEDARRMRIAATPATISPLKVVGPEGASQTLWDADQSTRVWLVTFMYTRCPSVCRTLGTELQQLQASLDSAGGVQLASLSFDREHDTPEALAAYARRDRADPARWLVAVPGSDAALARLLRETGVIAIDDGAGGYAHNAAIHVVTASGRLVALFDLESHREALAFAQALAEAVVR